MNLNLPFSAVVACSVLLLTPLASAQFRSGGPAALPGTPMTAPPAPHPALAVQPLVGDNEQRTGGGGEERRPGPSGPGAAPRPAPPPPPPAETMGVQREGKDLKRAIAKVNALKWHDNLADARASSAALGKPVFLLQALGDLEGFA